MGLGFRFGDGVRVRVGVWGLGLEIVGSPLTNLRGANQLKA